MKVFRIYSFVMLLTALMSVCMSSCSSDEPDDVDWDIGPQNFKFEIEDMSGNIIDPESEAWTDVMDKISVEYDGKVLTASEDPGIPLGYDIFPPSRYYLPVFKGLYYRSGFGGSSLCFGEFARDENYILEFKVNWPDGTSSEVKFENKFAWKKQEPKITSRLWIDGKEQKSTCVVSHKLLN